VSYELSELSAFRRNAEIPIGKAKATKGGTKEEEETTNQNGAPILVHQTHSIPIIRYRTEDKNFEANIPREGSARDAAVLRMPRLKEPVQLRKGPARRRELNGSSPQA